jgi:hypothetical protein
MAQTWQSLANLSLFLALLAISIIVPTGDGWTARQYQPGVGHCGITYADCRSGDCVGPGRATDDRHCGGDSHIDISLNSVGVAGSFQSGME